MTSGLRTLEEQRDERAVRRARDWRRLGLSAILAVVLAGLVGLLGVSSATSRTTGDGYRLSVTHARVTRAGVATPLHVRVVRPAGFDGPIRLAVSASLMERFDFQNFYPNPSKETSTGRWLVYDFDPPPGDVFRLSLDARTASDQNGSVDDYGVRLLDGSIPVAEVRFRMVVVP